MDFLVFHSVNFQLPDHSKSKMIRALNNEEYPVIITHILRNWKNKIGTFQIEDSDFIDWEKLKSDFPEVSFQRVESTLPLSGLTNKRKFWLYPQSDTLAHSLSIISDHLIKGSYEFVLPRLYKQQADTFLLSKNIPFKTFSLNYFLKEKPYAILFLNDWSKEARWLISLCHFFGVKTICIQESIIDFGDHFNRMLHADYVIIQGARTVSELDRDLYFITGNPRYEQIPEIDSQKNSTCIINCNFTYNIFEEIRYQWLDDITSVLNEKSIPFLISQHPRDNGDLSKYVHFSKSSSKSVHETLGGAKFVITRFSSLIHESLIMKIPVIYYNPHNEEMKYDFEFNDNFLFLARNTDELRNAINKIEQGIDYHLIDIYLSNHCLLKKELPSKQIADIAMNYPFQSVKPKKKDFLQLLLFYPALLKVIAKIKKLTYQ
jgi:hypothetical protein